VVKDLILLIVDINIMELVKYAKYNKEKLRFMLTLILLSLIFVLL